MRSRRPPSGARGGWFISPAILGSDHLPGHFRRIAESLLRSPSEGAPGAVVATARELLVGELELPDWTGAHNVRYLVVLDLPEPAVLRLPARLGLHKPHLRLHATRDRDAPRRLFVAQRRKRPFEGLVDAYVLGRSLVVVLGNMDVREMAAEEIPALEPLTGSELAAFEIDIDGSYLHWPERDMHLGARQLLREIDPEYSAELEIERIERDLTGPAIARMREERGLRQEDVAGLSARQVRRIEKGVSRLTLGATHALAAAFGMSLDEWLDEVARAAGRLRAERSGGRGRASA